MGWSFAYSPAYDKKACIAELRAPSRFGPQTKLLKACISGNHHWYLAETNGVTWIGLDLLQGGGRTGGWGHKSMDESSGPYCYDCPLSYLDAASAPVGHAAAWRESVRTYWADKKTKTLTPGLVVSYGGDTYTLIAPAGPRKGWTVDSSTGCRYRMNAKQLARATRVNTEVA